MLKSAQPGIAVRGRALPSAALKRGSARAHELRVAYRLDTPLRWRLFEQMLVFASLDYKVFEFVWGRSATDREMVS